MADDSRQSRGRGLTPFEKAERTNREARSQIDSEAKATRAKTARLKALRLEKEAAEPAPEKKAGGRTKKQAT